MYSIQPAVDTYQTGNGYPAVLSYENYDFKAENSIYNIPFQTPTDKQYDLRFKLNPNNRPTDLLSTATFNTPGLLINAKFIEVIEEFKIVDHELLKVEVKGGGSLLEYFWFHHTWTNWIEFVNWQKSKFQIFDKGTFSAIDINSYEKYQIEVGKSNYFRVACRTPILKQIDFDFYCHPFLGEQLVSDRLKEKIETEKLTGIKFKQKS